MPRNPFSVCLMQHASSQFAKCSHDTMYHWYYAKGYRVIRGAQWSGRHFTQRKRTELINQPSTSAKRLKLAAEASVFHNAGRVSMISPCVWHERSYQLSQQILSSFWLISDQSEQAGACDIGRVNAERLYPPLRCSWRPRKSAEFREGFT